MSNKQKVILCGLSKTGTTSICKALSILGYKTIHYMDPIVYIEDLLTKEDYDWNWVNDWDAIGDIPIPIFYRQLDRLFPNSKFILSIRPNKYEWLKSCKHQMEEVVTATTGRYVQKHLNKMIIDHHSIVRSLVYGCTHFNSNRYSEIYDEHLFSVLKYFDVQKGLNDKYELNDNLLVFNLFNKEGWKELCRFLCKDIPNQDFPHLGKRNK